MGKINDFISIRMDELVDNQECSPVGEYIEVIAEEVRIKFNIQCDTCHCGGFDSPGYEINCYAIAWINEYGKLEIQDFQEESY